MTQHDIGFFQRKVDAQAETIRHDDLERRIAAIEAMLPMDG